MKNILLTVGLEPMALRSEVWCSVNWVVVEIKSANRSQNQFKKLNTDPGSIFNAFLLTSKLLNFEHIMERSTPSHFTRKLQFLWINKYVDEYEFHVEICPMSQLNVENDTDQFLIYVGQKR